MAKQYKNVYTILDKARKGELVTSGPSSLFKSMTRYKKPDIVTPHLHYLDEKTITRCVNTFLNSSAQQSELATFLSAHGINKTPAEIMQARYEVMHKFPKSLYNDFFNLFNKDISEISFAERSKENVMRYKFIEKANQPLHKIISIGSNVKSTVYTQHAAAYFMKIMMLKKFKDEPGIEQMMEQMQQEVQSASEAPPDQSDQDNQPQQQAQSQAGQNQQSSAEGNDQNTDQDADDEQEDSQNSQKAQSPTAGQGAGKSNEPDPVDDLSDKEIEKMLKNLSQMMDSKEHELEKEMEKAKSACENLDELYSHDEQSELWDELQMGSTAGKLDPVLIHSLADNLRNINMGMTGVKQFIKKILNNSISYFSSKETVKFEPLMETGHLDGLEDVYMLHPKLRTIFMDDMMVKDVQKIGKINIYIDISGSMGASCGVQREDGYYVSRLDFAKAFAIKMQEMDLLENVFTFNTHVYAKKNTLTDLLKINCDGGTTIDAVVTHIINKDENAIIITDADDHCSIYSPKAYFIGTEGATFRHFKYLDQYHHQMCVFDGTRVRKVNNKGIAQ